MKNLEKADSVFSPLCPLFSLLRTPLSPVRILVAFLVVARTLVRKSSKY